jgi:hypothetical protein
VSVIVGGKLLSLSLILDPGVKSMSRILGPGDVISCYDHFVPHPHNPDFHRFTRQKISRLFFWLSIILDPTTLATPLGRAIGLVSAVLNRMMSVLKVLCTDYAVYFQKP